MTDVWEAVADGVDPARVRPRLARDVQIRDFAMRWGNDYAIARNPRGPLYYRLTPTESRLAQMMDGSHTIAELVVDQLESSGELDADVVTELEQSLREGGFLATPYVDTYAVLNKALHPIPRWRARLAKFFSTLEIDWPNADGFVRALYNAGFKYAFTPIAVVVATAVALAGLVAFGDLVRPGNYHLVPARPGREFLIILALDLVLVGFHELGHALVLVRRNKRVNSAGFRIYFGAPSFYIESSEALMLDRGSRILQAFAGPFTELVLAAPAAIFVWAHPAGAVSSLLYKWAVLNYFVVFMNLMPMLELDGYWILADAIQIPDLRPRSLAFIRYDLWRKLRTRENWNRADAGLLAFGTLGVAFTVFSFWLSYFFWKRIFFPVIAAMWHGGIGGRILLFAIAALIGGPLVRAALKLVRSVIASARALYRRVRFASQKRWRVEAAELLDALPIFDDLPVEILNDVAGRVRLRTVGLGRPVFVQGDRADAFYVVRSGRLDVEESDEGRVKIVSTLARGSAFGEIGLLDRAVRTATVRATTRAELFVIDPGTFQRVLEEHLHATRYKPSLAQIAELRALPCFASLTGAEAAKLLAAGKWERIKPGTAVVEQGKASDAFYAVQSGRLEVIESGVGKRELTSGSFFGEVGLLLRSKRTATVRALTPVRAFRLDRAGFASFMRNAFRSGRLTSHVSLEREWHH